MGGSSTKQAVTEEYMKIAGDKKTGGTEFSLLHTQFHSGVCIVLIGLLTIVCLFACYWVKKKRDRTNPSNSTHFPSHQENIFRRIRQSFKQNPRSQDKSTQTDWNPNQEA